MEIERPSTADVEEMAALWVALATEQRDHGTHILPEQNREQITATLHTHAVTNGALVAREDDDIVGFVTFERTEGVYETDVDRGVVQNLYVRPTDRNAGVGRLLLDRAEEELAAAGADVVSVQTMADNAGTRRFYRRQGYAPHRTTLEKRLQDENHSKDHR